MTARRLAWALCAAALVLVLTGPVLLFVAESDEVLSISFAAVQISTSVVGAVVASRLTRNAVGWILLSMGVGLGFASTATAYGSLGTGTSTGPLPADDVLAWIGEWSFTPVIFGGVVFLLHVFPDGHFLSARWRLVGLLSAALVLCATVADMFAPGRLEDGNGIMNPVGATGTWADVVTASQDVVDPLALPVFASALAVPVIRLRRARGVERQQLKWIASALTLVALGLGLTAGAGNLLGDYSFFLALLSLAAMPIATGVAMLRYRLYDIDVVINRTLVYGALTASLAGFYLGSVLLLQLVLSSFTDGSSLAIAVSTLAVAAVFRPARTRIQRTVDRRFFRRKYDARQTLDEFGSRVRGQVDLADVGADLLAAVGSTVQPSHAALWLRTPEEAR
jgi:hypothetical protein